MILKRETVPLRGIWKGKLTGKEINEGIMEIRSKWRIEIYNPENGNLRKDNRIDRIRANNISCLSCKSCQKNEGIKD